MDLIVISSDRVLKISSREEPDLNKLLSSAKRINCKFVDTLHRSFIYSRNNNGPNIEPCGTPILTSDTYESCIPRTKYVQGYYGLVVVTLRLPCSPHPQRPQTLNCLRDNLKNPYQIASIFYCRLI